MNSLSIRQWFYLLSILLCLTVTPLLYFSVANYLEEKSLIEMEIESNQFQNKLKRLIHSLPRHQIISTQVLRGKIDYEKLKNSTQQIDLYFLDLENFPFKSNLKNTLPSNYQTAFQKWKQLKKEKTNPENNAEGHLKLIEDIKLAIVSMQFPRSPSLFLLELPYLQSLLYQIIYEITEIQDASNEKLFALISLLHVHLEELKIRVEQTITLLPSNTTVEDAFNEYFSGLVEFIHEVKQMIPSITNDSKRDSLGNKGYQVIFLGLKAWDLTTSAIGEYLKNNAEAISIRFWTHLLLFFFLLACTFILGFLGIQKIFSGIKEIGGQINRLSEGHSLLAAPPHGFLEFQEAAKPLKKLSGFVDEVVFNFKELIRGVFEIYNGNLNVRLHSPSQNKDFKEPLVLFNGMVENYDTLIHRLQELGFMLTNSVSQLTMSILKQETIIKEHETTSSQIAIAANEIFSTAKEFAASFQETTKTAEETSKLATKGKASLGQMENIIKQILDASSSIADKLAILNEKAGNITGVVTTITKVVEQTHLLSLNASIEAEKAGEFGKSFAIIAREIRRLSDQTGVSTNDIEKMINEIMSALSSSVMGVDDFTKEIRNGAEQVSKVGFQLSQIIEQVQFLIRNLKSINDGMQAQSEGAEQISSAITSLSHKAVQTTDSMLEFRDTIEELSTASNELRTLMPNIKKFSK